MLSKIKELRSCLGPHNLFPLEDRTEFCTDYCPLQLRTLKKPAAGIQEQSEEGIETKQTLEEMRFSPQVLAHPLSRVHLRSAPMLMTDR